MMFGNLICSEFLSEKFLFVEGESQLQRHNTGKRSEKRFTNMNLTSGDIVEMKQCVSWRMWSSTAKYSRFGNNKVIVILKLQ